MNNQYFDFGAPVEQTKACIHCGQSFPLDNKNFRKDKKSSDGFNSVCKICCKKRDAMYRNDKKTEINKPLNSTYSKLDNKSDATEVYLANILLKNAGSRARREKMAFNIELNDLLPLPAFCQYTGVPLLYNRENDPNSASIDRIDNSKGYEKDNIKIVTQQINKMKHSISIEVMEQRYKLYQVVLRVLGKI
tara:strand:+ start:994 stop:1566 length:573 start_codon:yes stop_codon:yes gene_type:complete